MAVTQYSLPPLPYAYDVSLPIPITSKIPHQSLENPATFDNLFLSISLSSLSRAS
ncbi:hypothetical protein D6C90_09625 [Aureobasidium pullulans]|uniref:Uncharacterized protein n=1 Tax=Aureobasidium pullulans TaxID=5580 RepID=A0A4S9T8A5_AURPU|nr:hypothetical protein D6C90_09625 [Aureobasidium pullulans]